MEKPEASGRYTIDQNRQDIARSLGSQADFYHAQTPLKGHHLGEFSIEEYVSFLDCEAERVMMGLPLLEDLKLSARSKNLLIRFGVYTVGGVEALLLIGKKPYGVGNTTIEELARTVSEKSRPKDN